MNIAIIFAGGSGVRMGAGMPKQFLEINGKPIIIHTLDNFQNSPAIDKIYIACKADYMETLKNLTNRFAITKVAKIVEGGVTGQDSIFHALKAAYNENPKDSIVLIHDGVRPFVSEEVIEKNIESVKKYGSAITCTAFFETPILSKDGHQVEEMPLKKETFTAQAPQSFYLGEIVSAHEEMRKINPEYIDIADSCNLYKNLGKQVYIVQGNRGNIKVTTPEDFYVLRALLQYKENEQILGLK
ncbi:MULTISPECIES: IspD/TarI family cytidylyltransferase [Bacillota]|jgi:D-ribitol-5-phosphate cytidylyltransferase|uniref:2-C-methyl-D-erythritol 4-phosphate cytidylyltransferase n=2 Tax=Amedibacillus TaxID=2749846 RepID=A0A7G9GNT0_9FIRM|nr:MULTISPECIES: IspD/TarI family cytidylyltransferase [Bacillota]QNM12462.1 2-C-methyl-D-erythritol 4-phosphate cytidylyltransferase [[Eubacterium] hominis]MCH4284231.1 2-C-methyl-D-erythritol 4-phosphate cytidylyltransferase [Amedibacillus hominis]RGB57518.1 2-C-methyl-D-erythritol 4-phosphate cytidylyltransferase [Absiella sp. AM22-9]RGB62375.1 2-C-methyl-D-erythritol 4-phosphate cytidylyltransferase [Absiella sp. AM10-20]RGB67779.1 2-C-methyl-D-erythritol 4-phosphate cytidylyltransferase [